MPRLETVTVQLTGWAADPERPALGDACPIERAITLLGRRSTVLLLREAAYGTSRFDDFVRRTGLTESVTAGELRRLVTEGLLAKQPYQEPGRRQRHEYVLTEAGHALVPILLALGEWGTKHRPHNPHVEARHAGCGAPIAVEVHCAAGHRVPEDEGAIVAEPA